MLCFWYTCKLILVTALLIHAWQSRQTHGWKGKLGGTHSGHEWEKKAESLTFWPSRGLPTEAWGDPMSCNGRKTEVKADNKGNGEEAQLEASPKWNLEGCKISCRKAIWFWRQAHVSADTGPLELIFCISLQPETTCGNFSQNQGRSVSHWHQILELTCVWWWQGNQNSVLRILWISDL